jgi:hypothetical protein
MLETIIDRGRPQAPHGIHVDEGVRLTGIGLKCAQRFAGGGLADPNRAIDENCIDHEEIMS